MRWIVLLLLVISSNQAKAQATWGDRQYTSRVCSNASCRMCTSIQSQLQSQSTVWKSQTTQPAGEYVEVQRQVKRCQNGRCWYETVTEYVFRPRSASNGPPRLSQAGAAVSLSAVTELMPTPAKAVGDMLRLLDPPASARLFDLGCGDGRILVHAAKHYGCTSIGIELNQESAELARKNAESEFVGPLVIVFVGDARKYDLTSAQYVTMYLYPELMAQLVPKLAKGTRIASYMHEIPGVDSERHETSDGVIYTGVKS